MAKDKRRNSEKRKEKSRDAARSRRGKESEIFSELAQALPLSDSVTSQLDKASIMRLSISMLKIHNILSATDQREENESDKALKQHDDSASNSGSWDHLYQKALEGFAFILSCDGDIVYLSESVSKYLGLQQIELIGQSIYEFAHPCDHEEIREMLTPKHSEDSDSHTPGKLDHTESRTQIFRLKSTLTSKGRNVNLKSATYKPMNFTGRLFLKSSDGSEDVRPATVSDSSDDNSSSGSGTATGFPFLVGVAEPIPHPSNIEVPLDSKTFLSKHSMNMHFLFCDDRIQELAGFTAQDMIGKSIYDFHHGFDCGAIEKAFKDLFSKGQTMTEPYRFLAKEGGYIWVVTQATVINNSRTLKPQSVVCVHYVVSGVEQQNMILSHVQEPLKEQKQMNPLLEHLPPKVELSTENIFAPKTKEMNESFFIPPQLKDTIRLLDEEPDLSYLAPNAGDDFLPVVFADKDTPNLLSPDMCSLKQEPERMQDTSYRANSSPASILSSNSSSRIASPKEYLNMTPPMDSFFQSMDKLSTVDGLGTDDEDSSCNIDFSGRAPYIPMDADQDLGLCPPTASVLFTQSEDLNPGLFGQTDRVFGPKQSLFEEPPQPPRLSIQDMLGGSTAVASIEQPVDTMYLQMKRPLDMNSLEKGPPKPKKQRLEHSVLQQQLLEQVVPQQSNQQALAQPPNPIPTLPRQVRQQQQEQQMLSLAKPKASFYPQTARGLSKDSMLLSLLLSGDERNHNYNGAASMGQKKLSHQLLLPNLTTQECEVNAPASTTHLLQGRELLSALEGITRPGFVNDEASNRV